MIDHFLTQVLILLVTAVVVVVVFHRLRIPSSLGYLLVGVLLGSYTPGPVIDAQPVRNLAEFGIVFLLFAIGLNFSMPQIHAMRHVLLGLGTAQVLLTMAAVGLVAWLLGLPATAAFVVGAGAVVAMVGAVIAAKAGIALLVIGLKAAGITIGGLLATILPAVLIFGVLALAVAGFVVAFRNNVGGIADFARGVWEKVSLAFRGLVQLFEQGGFSGAVRDELNRAETRGLKDFLINVFLWVNRIRNFFSGIAAGFSAGIEAARPTLEAFMNALTRLGTALGFLSERDDASTASARFREFGSTGERVGRVLATVFELIVQAMTAVVEVAEGVAQGWQWISAGGSVLWSALSQLGSKIGEVINYMFGSTSAASQNGSAWTALGNVIAFVIGWIVSTIGVLVSVISAAVSIISAAIQIVMSVFSGLADVITGVVFVIGGIINGSWSDIWLGMKLIAFGVVDAIIGVVLELAGAIAGVVDALSSLFGDGTQARDYTYCDDIIAGVLAALRWSADAPIGVEDFNLGGNRSVPTGAMVEEISRALGIKPTIQWGPMQPGDVQQTAADLTKSGAVLGYAPRTPFPEGIRRFVAWFRESYGRPD